jgi:phage protein U
MTSHQGATATAEQSTGMKDEVYNVVSVLYHALQGGETCRQYLHDAQEAGDQKLVQFFQEAQECHRHLATRAKEVLTPYLDHGMTGSQAHGHSSQRREHQEHRR